MKTFEEDQTGRQRDQIPVGRVCRRICLTVQVEPVAFPHNTAATPVWEQLSRGEMRGATLEHTIWFHRPARVDEWLLHEQESPVADDSRGLATGRFYTAAGVLVATVAQEVAILHVADVGPSTRAPR